MKKKVFRKKGLVCFKDGHTEEIVGKTITFEFETYSGIIAFFKTKIGEYMYYEKYENAECTCQFYVRTPKHPSANNPTKFFSDYQPTDNIEKIKFFV